MSKLERRVLLLAQIWPERKASAASNRTLSLIKGFLDAGYALTVSADGRETDGTQYLREIGCTCVRMAPNDKAFDSWVAELAPAITVFDRFTTEEKFSWRVRAACPQSIRVLDTIDLHFLRLGREKALRAGKESPLSWSELREYSGDILLRELASIYRSDLSLLTSDFEMKLLAENCGVAPSLFQLCRLVYPKPLSLDSSSLPLPLPLPLAPFESRKGFMMLGTFRHPPNEDSLQYLRYQLWPRIRAKLPGVEVRIWGAHAQPRHLALSDHTSGLKVKGHLDNLGEAFARSRVNLAPLRYGAGIKGKIADGWTFGTPALATSVAAEGMHGDLPFGGLVRDGLDALVEGAVALYEDANLWAESVQSGLRIIDTLYNQDETILRLLGRLESLQVESGRFDNMLGEILWQQSLRSTEYFSRWLEAKGDAKRGLISE